MILGQHFRYQPEIFARAREKLAPRILHFGYADSRDEYAALLQQGDVVVSTARHEFFGIAVLEAVRSGCRPLVPDRLSYRELFPVEYRYDPEPLADALKRVLKKQSVGQREKHARLAERFSWPLVAQVYKNHLSDFCTAGRLQRKVGAGCTVLDNTGEIR